MHIYKDTSPRFVEPPPPCCDNRRWVLLMNCHLFISWLTALEKEVRRSLALTPYCHYQLAGPSFTQNKINRRRGGKRSLQ